MKKPRLLVATIIGLLFGSAVSLWSTYAAKAAVVVRPKLADVGFITAILSGHGSDWLFYHHPVVGSVVVIAIATFGLITTVWINS